MQIHGWDPNLGTRRLREPLPVGAERVHSVIIAPEPAAPLMIPNIAKIVTAFRSRTSVVNHCIEFVQYRQCLVLLSHGTASTLNMPTHQSPQHLSAAVLRRKTVLVVLLTSSAPSTVIFSSSCALL